MNTRPEFLEVHDTTIKTKSAIANARGNIICPICPLLIPHIMFYLQSFSAHASETPVMTRYGNHVTSLKHLTTHGVLLLIYLPFLSDKRVVPRTMH